MIKNLFCLSLFAILLNGCTTYMLLEQTEFKGIPVGSKSVKVEVSYSKDSLFNVVSRNFARYGCPVKTDKSAMQILCDGKSVEGGTNMKLKAFVDDNGNGSYVTISGDYGLDASGQIAMNALVGNTMYSTLPVEFNGKGTTRADISFQHMVILAKQLNGKISYL